MSQAVQPKSCVRTPARGHASLRGGCVYYSVDSAAFPEKDESSKASVASGYVSEALLLAGFRSIGISTESAPREVGFAGIARGHGIRNRMGAAVADADLDFFDAAAAGRLQGAA